MADLLSASAGSLSPDLQVFAYRRDDLLNLRFDLYNLQLDIAQVPPTLVPVSTSSPSWLVGVFSFQSIAEFADQVGAAPPASWPLTPVESLASGPSQLAFTVPAEGIPYTLASLTTWSGLGAILPAVCTSGGTVAATDPTGAPTSASPPQTYIEMAWHLLVAPGPSSTWTSPASPVGDGTWTELWQAQLTASPPGHANDLYAVWTPGYVENRPLTTKDPFNTSLSDTAGDNTYRTGLVALSSLHGLNPPANGIPAIAKTFMLTPLGVTADIQGTWDDTAGPPVPIVSWTHRMSTGRDTFVRVVEAGYLYPFGHRAVKIQTTDREFQVSPSGDTVAYLVERTTVQITQPTVAYPYPDAGAVAQPFGGRQNPFVSVEARTLTTPPIDPTSSSSDSPPVAVPGVSGNDAIWVNVEGSPFPFSFVATDAEGRAVDFVSGAVWVVEGLSPTLVDKVVTDYRKASNLAFRTLSLGGQLLAFAEPSDQPGATALHVDSLVLDSTEYNNSSSGTSPPWYPVLSQTYGATVRLPAVAALTATDGPDAASGAVAVYEATTYLPDGFPFPAGVPEVFLTFSASSPPPPLDFTPSGTQSSQTGSSQSGGVVAPNFKIDAFARDKGPVADHADLLKGSFDPSKFFAGLNATLLGAVPLADILQVLTAGPHAGPYGGASSADDQTPQVNSVPVYKTGQTAPVAIKTTIDWAPTIQSALDDLFQPGDPNGLQIHAQLLTPLQPPGPPASSIDGDLSDFTLLLFGSSAPCIQIHFTSLHFSQRTGSKSTVTVNIDTVEFVGALSFIQSFEELFASLGGPSIDLQPSGVTASYSVSLPSIGIGVFALENISLGGSLTIPFTGQPVRLRVNFCTRENPFLLTIYFFTGGGWFAISLGADGIELVEVGLEFGASISLDLGVASGGVSVSVGIYFALGTDTVTLTGFFQASGNLEVLGIVSISIVFYLGLTYEETGGKSAAYGTATVTVTVSVLCFSASVGLTVTKEIYSSDPVIPFSEAISETAWSQYCGAFA